MKRRRGIRPERDKDEGGGVKLLLRFFIRHGEKFVAGVLFMTAVWIALQVRNHQPLPWTPDDLEQLAGNTEEIIRNNESLEQDYEIGFFDFAEFATQMRERLPIEPFRHNFEWHPIIHPAPPPRTGFEILSARSWRGEAVRRAGFTTQGKPAVQWQRPPMPGVGSGTDADHQIPVQHSYTIWVNLYGTLPVWEQWDLFSQVLSSTHPASRPQYVYYELERTEIKPKAEPVWKPIIVDAADPSPGDQGQPGHRIPFGQPQDALLDRELFLFSDFEVEPAATYAYRIRLYVSNPNFNLQETSVAEGVDTQNEFIRSDWSSFARVYVPDRTLVQLQSVTPTDQSEFPRQITPLSPVRGTLLLDYFDVEQGLSLPLVEQPRVVRGMLGNMSKEDANRFINRGNTGDVVVINYPDTGLRSNVCILDFSGGRSLQKRLTRTAQASPDLTVPGKALLLMPNGMMQTTSSEPELFR